MNITIRHENKQDYRRVEEVAREAFWNLYFPGCHEHHVVHKIREHQDFIPELSFIIEVDEEIMGGIFYTHSKVVDENGVEYPTISFGPVFIHPDMHRKGIGRRLITHSITEAKKLGYKAITTLGYDYHYAPYGFKGGKAYNISMPDGNFYKGLLVLPLEEGALDHVSGYALHSEGLETTDEEVDAFDAMFPVKEKLVQASQKEFEIASMALDE